MSDSFILFVGRTAYANAALIIASMVTLMIFFSIGGFWGQLNDSVSVLWALSFIPLLIVLYQVNNSVSASLSLATTVIGIGAMIVFAVLQSLLVLIQIQFKQTLGAVHTMTGVLGLSLLLSSLLAPSQGTLPAGMVWIIAAYGLGSILGSVGFWIGGQQHPLTLVGFLAAFILGPIWAIWLGRVLLRGADLSQANISAGGAL
jgi:hypothetical protein